MIGYVNWGFGVPENASKNQGLKFNMANPIWLTQMSKLLLSLAPNCEWQSFLGLWSWIWGRIYKSLDGSCNMSVRILIYRYWDLNFKKKRDEIPTKTWTSQPIFLDEILSNRTENLYAYSLKDLEGPRASLFPKCSENFLDISH